MTEGSPEACQADNVEPQLLQLFAVLQVHTRDMQYIPLTISKDPAASSYDPALATRTLTCICLLIGRLQKKELEKLMQKIAAKLIFGIVMKQLYAAPAEEKVHILAVQLIQRTLTTCVQDGGIDFMVQSLLELLDQARDATSKAIVAFLAEYAARYKRPCCISLKPPR